MGHEDPRRQVVIIGAGLAGLSAAQVLAGGGASVLLLDEGLRPGGQYLKRPSPPLGDNPSLPQEARRKKGLEIIKAVKSLGLECRPCTQVLGVEPDGRAGWMVWGETASGVLAAWRSDFIIIASGAREKFIPFKGWTLPGIISTGAVQLLLKGSGVVPAAEVVVAGSGPLPLAVAGELIKAGSRVPALLDYGSLAQKLAVVKLGSLAWGKIWEGIRHQARLMASGGKLRNRTAVLEGRGHGRLEEIVTVQLDRRGKPMSGSQSVLAADCLAIGHGFAPNIELAQQAGCELEHDPLKGGWVVRVDGDLQTSLPACYAAGEVSGIAGAEKSYIEGRMAGLLIACKLDLISGNRVDSEIADLVKRRNQQLQLGAFINRLCHPPAGLGDLIEDETIICRCEDVTAGEIRAQIGSGATRLTDIKLATRTGMGLCQGRTCGPMLEAIIQTWPDAAGPEPPPPLPARMPVKPFNLSALVEMDLEKESEYRG